MSILAFNLALTFALNMALAVQLGMRANGAQASRSYIPTLRFFSAEFAEACADAPDIADDIPIPEGMQLFPAREGRQPQLVLSEAFAQRHRRVWGYIGEIKLIDSDFTQTGALLQIVCLFPWRYGSEPEETTNSFIYARVNCFTSTAAFSNPIRMLKLGECVSGFIEVSSKTSRSAQLTGWDICSPADWLAMSESTFPSVFELHKDAIFHLPQLSSENFTSFYPPNVPYYVAESPTVPKYFQTGNAKKAYDEYVY